MDGRLTRTRSAGGQTIIHTGGEAREMYLLVRGRVSVQTTLTSGSIKRLATFVPGMVFGEIAVIDRAPRSAMIIADTATECARLTRDDFEELDRSHPAIKLKLWQNLCSDICGKLRKANRELNVFE